MRTVSGPTSARLRAILFATFALTVAASLFVATTNPAHANAKYAGLVIDAKTGKVLYSRNANAKRYPASLTKMMTLYLIFEDLKSGRIKLSDRVVMTQAGARRPPSKLGIRVGGSLSVEQALLSLVTKSANDVATAVGDKLSGSEAEFAKRMTRKARQLGMKNTTFKNASGLTARGQLTTAHDMAMLGMALREHFPRRYSYFQTRLFKFGKRRYGNHNKLLGRVRGVDGIKTGYTSASGFNLVSSVRHNGRSIVAVVMGGRTGARRNAQMEKLIAAYLPKASRGAQRRQVARATNSATGSLTSTLASLKDAPTPTFARRTVASDTPATYASTAGIAAITPASRESTSVADSRIVAEGWHVQVAAGDNRSELTELLARIKSRNPSLLDTARMYTPKVTRGGSTFYRARFVGFENKSTARRVCQALKRAAHRLSGACRIEPKLLRRACCCPLPLSPD